MKPVKSCKCIGCGKVLQIVIGIKAPLKITLFASFQVALNGRSLTDFATDKARALLAYLAVERQHPHRRESLAALLWPDQPDARARQNLRQALSNLRQALGDTDDTPIPFLLIDRHEVQMNPQAEVWLDVAEFTGLASACDHHRHRQIGECLPCLQRQEALLALYPGDFLAGFSLNDSAVFEEWAMLKREWLHCQAVEALAQLADYYERRGDVAAARRLAQQQVRLEPWREEAHRQLMRLLAADGQRSAALAQFETCRRALARELGVGPTAETIDLYTAVREGAPFAAAAKHTAVAGLPQTPTPFVGRVAECAELAEWLADPDGRLITLVGPGGIGKTRLAMQVAEAQVGLYPDGVYWIGLAAVHAAALIIPTIAQAVGLTLYGKEPPESQLLAFLREKRVLLALDNVEHLPEAAGVIAAVLQQAPRATLLVTSRERLALREEWLFAVEGLAFAETAVAASAAPPEAAQLFVQSVRRADRKFAPTPTDWTAVADICRLVEGMPLALELAAAWVPDLSCADIARGLAADSELLTASWQNAPERQRSVQATFEHSWALLPEAERLFFARLAVFRGGFAGQAAAQVAGVAAAALAQLAAKSLVRRVGDGRYQLHELLRQFGAIKLAALTGETERVAGRHAAYYLGFLAGQEAALKGAGQEEALIAIYRDIANVRQAWDWAVDETAGHHLAAADLLYAALEALFLFYALRSWYQEGAGVFARAETAVSPAIPNHLLLRGELLARQARCLEFTAPPEEAITLYEASLACFRAVGAEQAAALPLYGLGYMAHIRGDYEASRRYFMESLARYEAAGNRWGMANVHSSLCLTLRRQGAFADAGRAGRESLVIRRDIGDWRGIASSQNNLGLIYCALGEYAAAEAALQESVAICREIGHTVGVANALTSLCHVFVDAKAYARAAEMQREAQDLYREVGDLWGVAIAYNNLGQIALEDGRPMQAQTLLQEAAQIYRGLSIQSSLAHTLSNLGKTSYELGDVAGAVLYLTEGLEVAAEIGDRPIMLELLTRMAALGAEQMRDGRSLRIMAFALRQPELFAETRGAAVAQFAAMRQMFTAGETAVAECEAGQSDFQAITAMALGMMQQMSGRVRDS